jgi:molybdopterin-dependent oxidoreductase alpha subunit
VSSHRTPESENEPVIGDSPKSAAGLTSLRSTTKHLRNETGIVRGFKILSHVNQKGGFDCPGCAWPDPDDERSSFEYCENGAKAVAEEATKKRVTPEFFAEHSIEALSLQSDHWLGKQGRITHPMVRKDGAAHYEPIEWNDAFALLASELNALESPDGAAFYTSGRTSNEAAYLYQLFVRMFGTNNLPDCSNMCHESSGKGLSEVIGVSKGTVTLQDLELADVIVVIGQNPGTNHPRMLSTLLQAKRRGATIIHINPLPETGLDHFKHPQKISTWLGKGAKLADLFLQVKVNGDVALLKGMAKALLSVYAALDTDFIRDETDGFEAFRSDIDAAEWEEIERESGIDRAQIERAAETMKDTGRIIFCWAMGLTQHENAVANIQMIVNILLMKGAIGKPGAGACPVRGHSNVQGDRTVGITHSPKSEFLDKLGERYGFEPPRSVGLDTVETIKAMHSGDVSIFFGLGGNFLSATPDTDYTAEAIRRCSLTAHVSTKLNRAHLVTGRDALIFPCLGRTEIDQQFEGRQMSTVENSMGIVHTTAGHLKPASEHLLSESTIVARLADAVFGESGSLNWSSLVADYDVIRDEIEATIPGFENYNVRVRNPGGFYLPNAARDCRFNTSTGKARFTVHPIPDGGLEPGQYLMMTMRSHDQYNTTIYGLDDRYRGIKGGRRVIFMNALDASDRGFEKGSLVDIESLHNGVHRRAGNWAVVPFSIPRGCVATYFPEANVLVPIDKVAKKSNTPASKSVVVTLERST